jgi:hypothetical protein
MTLGTKQLWDLMDEERERMRKRTNEGVSLIETKVDHPKLYIVFSSIDFVAPTIC